MNSKILMKRACMALFMFLLCTVAFAQRTVKGVVLDANGEPIIGANVLEKGSTNGTITDIEGNFSLSGVSANSTLVFSYIGYISQEIKADKKELKVTLQEDSKNLDEVVVIGYGVQKKSDVTGSVSSVTTEALNAKGASSVIENLQGSTPGVSITQSSGRTNGGFGIEIRGKSSINSDTTPLFVVDGVMCDDIDFLNPQDIERIDVLKDASSTAIYGSRATAGVVMVTTKGGLAVNKEQKPTISYDGYYGISKVTRMPDFMTGEQFYKYRFLKFLISAESGVANPIYSMGNGAVEQGLLREHVGSGEYMLKSMLQSGATQDWPSLVTQDGQQQNHYLSVNGGGKVATYHFGVGYNRVKGIYKGDAEQRYNFKGSVDAKVNKVISAGFSMNMAYSENEYANDNAISVAFRMNPFMQPYDADGNINHKPGAAAAVGTDGTYQFSDQVSALDLMKNTKQERETWRILGNVYLKLDIIKGLNFKTTFSPSYTSYRLGSFAGYINPVTNKAYDDSDTNSASLQKSRSFSWTWDNVVNYNTTIAKKHDVGLMGLVALQKGNTESSTWAATDVMAGTDWYNLTSGTFDADGSKYGYSDTDMLSYALRGNYAFMGKYLLTATVRWDGSSKFADGYRWGCFPSAAVAWRMSEEAFIQKYDWISNLKLRFSYGVTGNCDGIGAYATQVSVAGPVYYPFGTSYSSGFYASDIVDRMLKWETSRELNVGLDYGFLGGRINGTVDWYRKTSEDLLYPVLLPLETGGITMTTNVGSVRNTGVEVSLTTENIKKKDLTWSTTFTFASNSNKVLEINGIDTRYVKGTTNSLFVGSSVYNVYNYKMGGIVDDRYMTVPNTQIAKDKGFTPGDKVKSYDYYYACYGLQEGQPYVIDRDGNGTIDDNDKYIFSSNPSWTGSFSTNLTYKNWDFNMSLYTKQNYTVYSNFMNGDQLAWNDRGRQKLNVNYYIPAGTLIDCDGVNADGTIINPVYQVTTHYGEYPFPNNGGSNGGVGAQASYYNVAKANVDASYVKVKNITLGYTVPKSFLNKFGCQKLRIYATVTNPFVFTNYKGFDPEWAGADAKNDGPSTVTYQIGASVKF